MLPSNASDWERTNPPLKKRGGSRGGLLFTIGLLVLLIAVIALAVTRLPTGTLSRPTAAPGQTAEPAAAAPAAAPAGSVANGVPPDAPTQQAIQDVIKKVDDAQATAIATKDPNVMADSATPEFYQLQVTTNQDLVDNGVTDVKLVNLEWGDISVAGNTATATVYETWSTTFDDGTTEQARDRNVYTLVQDNGAWKVSADDHPDQQAASVGGPTPAP